MNPAEVIEREIDRQHRFEVLPLLRECVSQASHSPHTGTDAEV